MDRNRPLIARLALPGLSLRLHQPLLAPSFPPNFLPLSPTSPRRSAHPRFSLSSHALFLALSLHASNSFGCTLCRRKQVAKISFGGPERRALRRTETESTVPRFKRIWRMERRKDTSMQRFCGNYTSPVTLARLKSLSSNGSYLTVWRVLSDMYTEDYGKHPVDDAYDMETLKDFVKNNRLRD